MNYKSHYDKLTNSRKKLDRNKQEGIYYETHHILPKCLGGTNEKENLVLLTFKEHYLAHLLLTKMYIGNDKRKMLFAFSCMSRKNKCQQRFFSSKQYALMRRAFYEAQLGSKHPNKKKPPPFSKEHRKKISDSSTGRKHSDAAKEKISKKNKGKDNFFKGKKRQPFTIEHIKKIGESSKGRKQPESAIEKRRQAVKDKWKNMSIEERELYINEHHKKENNHFYKKKHSDESKKLLSLANKGRVFEKILCPYCNKLIAKNTAKRYHFLNCKNETIKKSE